MGIAVLPPGCKQSGARPTIASRNMFEAQNSIKPHRRATCQLVEHQHKIMIIELKRRNTRKSAVTKTAQKHLHWHSSSHLPPPLQPKSNKPNQQPAHDTHNTRKTGITYICTTTAQRALATIAFISSLDDVAGVPQDERYVQEHAEVGHDQRPGVLASLHGQTVRNRPLSHVRHLKARKIANAPQQQQIQHKGGGA